MPNDIGNNTTNNENKFPNQGNFSASQNNIGANFGNIKNITNNQNQTDENKLTNNPTNAVDGAKKEIAKKGIEAAANAYAGPAGGEAAKAIMNSKLGNKALNAATNLNKSPLQRFGDFINKKAEYKTEEEQLAEEAGEDLDGQQGDGEGDSLIPKSITNKVLPAAAISGIGCLGVIIIIAIVATIFLAPIFYIDGVLSNIKEGATNIWTNIVYFFKGCDNEYECNQKEQDSFYEKLVEVHKKYQEDYHISLNTELITATLTYYDPMAAMNDLKDVDDLSSSSMVNFKKSEKKINELAKNMMGVGKTCTDALGYVIIQYKEDESSQECPAPTQAFYYATEEDEQNGKLTENTVTETKWYYVDEDKYKNYLQTSFINNFYFKNEGTPEQIKKVIDEIYSRVELVNYLNGSGNSSASFVANNSQVVIMNCTNTIELETVSLYEYLQGVLYAEGYAVKRSEEFLKVQAVMAKNYLYAVNGATPDSIPTTLKIRSCQMNQIYCNVEKGCHNLDDGKNNSWDTIATGPAANGVYFRTPVTDVAVLERIKSAIDTTLTEFIVKDNKFVTTQYRSDCPSLGLTCDATTNILDQLAANQMILSGSTYKEVLAHYYNGEIVEITLGAAGYPLDLVHNTITSAFGWRVHPIKNICRTHNGTDIAAPADANIYSIADGVVVENYYHSSYGNVTVIGHGTKDSYGNYQYYSLYAHQIRLSSHISVGQTVKSGQVIGNVGTTGTSTGNHLHIEIYSFQNGKKVRQDPVEYFKGVELTGEVGGALYNNESQCRSCINSYGASNC